MAKAPSPRWWSMNACTANPEVGHGVPRRASRCAGMGSCSGRSARKMRLHRGQTKLISSISRAEGHATGPG